MNKEDIIDVKMGGPLMQEEPSIYQGNIYQYYSAEQIEEVLRELATAVGARTDFTLYTGTAGEMQFREALNETLEEHPGTSYESFEVTLNRDWFPDLPEDISDEDRESIQELRSLTTNN